MKSSFARAVLVVAATFTVTLLSLHAEAAQCSSAGEAGDWAYTYTGTILTPNGPLLAASVGHFMQDREGNIVGSQTRSVAGSSGVEDISGTITVNPDCTGSGTVDVFVNGQQQRTTTIALVYDNNGNHVRAIFQALTLPDGSTVPVVITIDGNKLLGEGLTRQAGKIPYLVHLRWREGISRRYP